MRQLIIITFSGLVLLHSSYFIPHAPNFYFIEFRSKFTHRQVPDIKKIILFLRNPENVRSKIFQPFFTSKPSGQGTGFGLSLSYDIIAKGHGGELKVGTEEGKYADFIIVLPISESREQNL